MSYLDRPSDIQRSSNNNYSSNNNNLTPMVENNNITPVINLLKVVFDIEPLEKFVNFNDDINDENRDSK